MEGRVFEMFSKKLKNFQNSKNAQNPSQMSKRVLNKCWGNSFKKLFCPVFHGGSSLRNVFKNRKFFKIPKRTKNVPQKCPNVFWTCFGVIFPINFFCPVFHLRNVFKKSKNFQISINDQNRSQKCQTCFEHVLG